MVELRNYEENEGLLYRFGYVPGILELIHMEKEIDLPRDTKGITRARVEMDIRFWLIKFCLFSKFEV